MAKRKVGRPRVKTPKKPVFARIKPDLYKKLQVVSGQESRSMSATIEIAIENYVQK